MSFICHIHNYTQYKQQWNVFSTFALYKYTHTWSSGQPTLRRPGSSWGFSALLKGLTSVVDNSCWSRDSNPQPRVTSLTLYPLEPRLPPNILLVWQIQACHWTLQASSMAWRSGTCLRGAYWKTSTSMWRKTLQSDYSRERGVWGKYKVINCGWAWNRDCSQCCR